MKSDLIDITVRFVHQTEKAWLVNDGVKDIWVPKSWCDLIIKHGMVGELTITERLAEEKGFTL